MHLSLPLFPQTHIDIVLFNNVTNAAQIKSKIISPEMKTEGFVLCAADPSMIVSTYHIANAIERVFLSKKTRTKNTTTEIIYYLSPSRNV